MSHLRSERLRRAIERLHEQKTADYGTAWKKRGEVLGVLANEARKVDRIEEVGRRQVATTDETIFDTYVDLFVYGLKHHTLLADEDDVVAAQLGVSALSRPYSDGVTAFNVILSRIDLSGADVFVKADWSPNKIIDAFAALEKHYSGTAASASTANRASAVQRMIDEALAGMSATINDHPASFDAFLAKYGGS